MRILLKCWNFWEELLRSTQKLSSMLTDFDLDLKVDIEGRALLFSVLNDVTKNYCSQS